jgi:hypothetical protein
MFVAIAVLVIVAAAIAASAVHRFIDSFVLATILQLILLAAVVAILESMLSRFSFFLIASIVDADAPVALDLLKRPSLRGSTLLANAIAGQRGRLRHMIASNSDLATYFDHLVMRQSKNICNTN